MVVAPSVAARSSAVVLWKIEQDPAAPGRLVMRDEQGRAHFVSRDAGRTWAREDVERGPYARA